MDWLIEKEKREFELAHKVMVMSNLARNTLVSNGVPEGKIFVNHCGVDLSIFSHQPQKNKVFRIIQCSSMIPRKGVHYLVRAFSELNFPNSELWLVGGGLYDPVLKRMIRKHMRDSIHIKGHVPQNLLPLVYNQCSVFVLPSVADGFAVVVPQAMACGLPVIVTDMVGSSEIVNDGKDGFVVKARSIDAIKEKLIYLYNNQDICCEMGVQATHNVQNGFTWDDYGDRLFNFLGLIDDKHR